MYRAIIAILCALAMTSCKARKYEQDTHTQTTQAETEQRGTTEAADSAVVSISNDTQTDNDIVTETTKITTFADGQVVSIEEHTKTTDRSKGTTRTEAAAQYAGYHYVDTTRREAYKADRIDSQTKAESHVSYGASIAIWILIGAAIYCVIRYFLK